MSTDTADVATATRSIRNPVLAGFHPDPSILRVGDDYYLATSTFEWYPGVRVHHSRDLVHWRTLGGIITDRRLLDLRGCGDSNGVWAPDLTYHDGQFHLVYSDVASFASGYWDPQNFLVTAPDITGPWSDPVKLHGRGFDAALFHDDDGTSWLLSMSADWRPGRDRFGGIEIQQYDRAARTPRRPAAHPVHRHPGRGHRGPAPLPARRLVLADHRRGRHQLGAPGHRGPVPGAVRAVRGGPGRPAAHLRRPPRTAVAEGRPRQPGPYAGRRVVPRPPGRPPLLPAGQLRARPGDRDPAGRVAGGRLAAASPEGCRRTRSPHPTCPRTRGRRSPTPTTSTPPSWARAGRRCAGRPPRTGSTCTVRPSHLRIHGGQSPVGRQAPSLVARRVGATHCSLETVLEFDPVDHRQLAGITAYYNTLNWHHLYLTRADDGRTVLELLSSDNGRRTAHPELTVDASGVDRVGLRAVFDGPVVRFDYDLGAGWQRLPVDLDATILSDEHAALIIDGEPAAWGFTGAFLGLWVQDLGGDGAYADFDLATYREH